MERTIALVAAWYCTHFASLQIALTQLREQQSHWERPSSEGAKRQAEHTHTDPSSVKRSNLIPSTNKLSNKMTISASPTWWD